MEKRLDIVANVAKRADPEVIGTDSPEFPDGFRLTLKAINDKWISKQDFTVHGRARLGLGRLYSRGAGMKTSFWERLRFLFDPESLEISIYEVHRKILDDVTLERRKLENDKRYVWVRMRKLQDEVRLLNQEILEMKSGRAGDELRDDLDGKGLRWQRPKDMDEG